MMQTVLQWGAPVLAQTLIQTVAYWLGAKITGNQTAFGILFQIALAGALIAMIPYVGWILAYLVALALLAKLCDMDVWPDAVLTAIIAGFFSDLTKMLIEAALTQ